MPISCHFRDCKALLVTSLTHVSGAIASAQTFTFSSFIFLNSYVDSTQLKWGLCTTIQLAYYQIPVQVAVFKLQ